MQKITLFLHLPKCFFLIFAPFHFDLARIDFAFRALSIVFVQVYEVVNILLKCPHGAVIDWLSPSPGFISFCKPSLLHQFANHYNGLTQSELQSPFMISLVCFYLVWFGWLFCLVLCKSITLFTVLCLSPCSPFNGHKSHIISLSIIILE